MGVCNVCNSIYIMRIIVGFENAMTYIFIHILLANCLIMLTLLCAKYSYNYRRIELYYNGSIQW